jgi:N-formylglutamate deformylase
MREFNSNEDVLKLVHAFEEATVSRDDWKHREHLIVALHYVSLYDLETATNKMRTGILNLLERGFKVDLAKEMPYHETMTVFWIRTVAKFHASWVGDSMAAKIEEMTKLFDKNYPLRFYSRELLFSDKARIDFVEGDIDLFDTVNQ